MSTSASNPQHDYTGIVERPQPLHDYNGIVEQPAHDYEGIVEAAPPKHNYDGIVEPATPRVTVTTNEDADFDSPLPEGIEGFKPIDFKPFETSDLSFTQRMAAGGARIAGANTSGLPENSPDRAGKIVKASVHTGGRMPSPDELSDALLASLGAPGVGQRYRAETGHNIALPAVSDEDLKRGYDANTQTYNFTVQPARSDVRIVNAYGTGGIKGAEAEIELMRAEGEDTHAQQVRERDAAREAMRRLGYDPDQLSEGNGAVAKGIGDAVIGTSRLINNASGLFTDPQQSADNAEFINQMSASIPEEKTGVGRVVRGMTGIAARAPQYVAAGPAVGALAYTENLDKGQERAIKEGLKIGVASGVAQGAGVAFESLSPTARQVASRVLAGQTNVALDKLSGSDRSALESFLEGALLPVGKGKGQGREAVPERFTHPSLGELEAVADQSGIGKNFMRVRRVEDGEVGVVRRPGAPMPAGLHPESESKPTSKTGEKVLDLINIPRAVETAYDLSGIGRQGLILSVLHPGKAAKAFARSLPTFFSEAKADDVLREIHSSPLAPLRHDAGLYLADYHKSGLSLTAGEEGFQSRTASDLIPGVRASERAYVTFLDKLRADVFDGYAETHPDASPETLKNIAGVINDFTGRGSLGKFGEKHATVLSQAFYSPRFQISRVSSLTRPFRGTPEARIYAAKELTKFVAAGVGFMGLARAAGLQVSLDPLSSSFGRVKIGNTYVDLWGGFQPLARYTAQLIAGESRSMDGELRPKSRLQTALNFLRTKAAPQIAVPLDTFLGSDVQGKPATLSNAPKRAFMPLAWGDVEDAVREDLRQGGSGLKGAAAGSLGLFGAGVNTIEQGAGVNPNLPDERRRLRLPDSQSQPVDNALSRIVAAQSYQALSGDDVRLRLLHSVQKSAIEDEAAGLSTNAILINAAVNAQVMGLRSLIDAEKSLTPEQRERLMHEVNSRFYYARVRPGERRDLSAVQRVFSEQAKDSEKHLRERMEALKHVRRD